MAWIKKNPVQFVVMIVAVMAIAASIYLLTKIQSFSSEGEGKPSPAPAPSKEAGFGTKALEEAQKAINEPAAWQIPAEAGRLFVADPYVLDGKNLVDPLKGMFHPPVPNKWLAGFNLDYLSKSVMDEDPDKDGFTTRQEWEGLDTVSHLDNNGQQLNSPDGQPLPPDSTNPIDPKSHPPYFTQLRLTRVISTPFRLRFMAYDLNPNNPAKNTFQINTVDQNNRTYFLELNTQIPGTKFKTKAFQFKDVPDKDGTRKDVSELTVTHIETGVDVVLPIGLFVNHPDLQAVFHYLWKAPGEKESPDFVRKRSETFTLVPETDQNYKVLDIKASSVDIELPTSEKRTLTLPK